MSLYSQNRQVLEDIKQVIGGRIIVEVTGNSGVYRLDLAPRDTVAALKEMLPFLRIKKEQAQLALDLHRHIDTHNVKGYRNSDGSYKHTSLDTLAEREAMFLMFKELNHRDSREYRKTWVKSVETLRRATPSQASEGKGSEEGVTTSPMSPNNNSDQERPTSIPAGRHSLSNVKPQVLQ